MMKKVKWGILGTATIAWEHVLPGMQKALNCEIYAITGRSREKTIRFQEQFGIQKAYESYEELLDDPEVEAVYIPLPNDKHVEWTIKAAQKKKHVLCEKPLASNAQEVQRIIDVCKQEGVHFMEAFAYLHSELTKKVVSFVREGTIGDVTFIESSFIIPTPDTSNIRMRKETYGGSIYDVGCYNISLILRVLDEIPTKIKAMARFTDEGIDDYCSAYLEFPSGVLATTNCGMCSTQCTSFYTIHGTKGVIHVPIIYNSYGEIEFYVNVEGIEETITLSVTDNYQLEIEQFGRCVLEDEQPYVSADFSVNVATVLDHILDQVGY